MSDCIMVGCDLHAQTMVLRYAIGRGTVEQRNYSGDVSGRQAMMAWLRSFQEERKASRILFAYEASSQGFGLRDELCSQGIDCYVLAPTRIARSSKHARGKNDGRDALQLLELLRAHVLAGNDLPAVWIPDLQTRDDRELIRTRLDAVEKMGLLKNQVQSLIKRHELRRPAGSGKGWTNAHRGWLQALSCGRINGLGVGGQAALSSLLRQMEALESELEVLNKDVQALSQQERYAESVRNIRTIKGVGVLTAMVFLVELGDLTRFSNRRELAAYLGLVPTSNETGERKDCKGHITRQGPGRVRKVLCQATWALIRTDPAAAEVYAALVRRNPKHKKIAVVAIMRRLAIVMWHRALKHPPGNRSVAA